MLCVPVCEGTEIKVLFPAFSKFMVCCMKGTNSSELFCSVTSALVAVYTKNSDGLIQTACIINSAY